MLRKGFIPQHKYVIDLLKEMGNACKPANTPIYANLKSGADEEICQVNR